jgi:hypothetical protein
VLVEWMHGRPECSYLGATTTVCIALANVRYPDTPEDSVARVERAIAQADAARADLVCFPECYDIMEVLAYTKQRWDHPGLRVPQDVRFSSGIRTTSAIRPNAGQRRV